MLRSYVGAMTLPADQNSIIPPNLTENAETTPVDAITPQKNTSIKIFQEILKIKQNFFLKMIFLKLMLIY